MHLDFMNGIFDVRPSARQGDGLKVLVHP